MLGHGSCKQLAIMWKVSLRFFLDVQYWTVWGKSQEIHFTDDPDKNSVYSEYY